jgi:serine/threonine-protein kinase
MSLSALDPLPTDVLEGKYRLVGVLGSGGMGVVYRAYHQLLGLEVAIKVLHPEIASDDHARSRLVNEARAAARIDNEHITRVMEVGELEDGLPFLVMERLHGSDFQRLLATRGKIPVSEAVGYVLEALEAVAAAHDAGIVHRDLKPSNLFLAHRKDDSTIVKVLDFGIAKLLVDSGSHAGSITRTGSILGSPAYMAPEQLRAAKQVDLRADIWSMGVILYELLTAVSPFGRDHPVHILAAILEDDPTPPRRFCPEIPRGLELVILRCLRRDRRARFAGARELSEALVPFRRPHARTRSAVLDTPRAFRENAPSSPILDTTVDEFAASGGHADPLRLVFELGVRGRRRRSAAGALATSVTHAALAAIVLSCGDLAVRAVAPPDAADISIELEPTVPERPVHPASVSVAGPTRAGAEATVRHALAGDHAGPARAAGPRVEPEPAADESDLFDTSRVADEGNASGTSRLGPSIATSFGATRDGKSGAADPGGKGSTGHEGGRSQRDRARPAWLHTNVIWDCGFPWEGDVDKINYAAVRIAVTVKPDGSAESAEIVADPGHGFGRVARSCAMRQQFIPALDHDGRPFQATTQPFTVAFRRQ